MDMSSTWDNELLEDMSSVPLMEYKERLVYVKRGGYSLADLKQVLDTKYSLKNGILEIADQDGSAWMCVVASRSVVKSPEWTVLRNLNVISINDKDFDVCQDNAVFNISIYWLGCHVSKSEIINMLKKQRGVTNVLSIYPQISNVGGTRIRTGVWIVKAKGIIDHNFPTELNFRRLDGTVAVGLINVRNLGEVCFRCRTRAGHKARECRYCRICKQQADHKISDCPMKNARSFANAVLNNNSNITPSNDQGAVDLDYDMDELEKTITKENVNQDGREPQPTPSVIHETQEEVPSNPVDTVPPKKDELEEDKDGFWNTPESPSQVTQDTQIELGQHDRSMHDSFISRSLDSLDDRHSSMEVPMHESTSSLFKDPLSSYLDSDNEDSPLPLDGKYLKDQPQIPPDRGLSRDYYVFQPDGAANARELAKPAVFKSVISSIRDTILIPENQDKPPLAKVVRSLRGIALVKDLNVEKELKSRVFEHWITNSNLDPRHKPNVINDFNGLDMLIYMFCSPFSYKVGKVSNIHGTQMPDIISTYGMKPSSPFQKYLAYDVQCAAYSSSLMKNSFFVKNCDDKKLVRYLSNSKLDGGSDRKKVKTTRGNPGSAGN